MPPLTRFTAYENNGASDWSVFDHVRRHSISGGQSKERRVHCPCPGTGVAPAL